MLLHCSLLLFHANDGLLHIPQPRTVLTNLQRGNIQTEAAVVDPVQLSFHQRAGKGEITRADLENGNPSTLKPIRGVHCNCFYR